MSDNSTPNPSRGWWGPPISTHVAIPDPQGNQDGDVSQMVPPRPAPVPSSPRDPSHGTLPTERGPAFPGGKAA